MIKIKNLEYIVRMKYILLIIFIAYFLVYFGLRVTPGNSPLIHPLGWWGWFDQGQYLKSSAAFLNLNFSSDQHFYPPLYPAIGGIFLAWSSGHPFFLINLLCVLWFSYVFIKFSDLYISRGWGVFILLFSTIFSITVFQNFVIPWTTTLSTGFISTGILGLVLFEDVRAGRRKNISSLEILFGALCLGLVLPTRPIDSVISMVFVVWFLASYFLMKQPLRGAFPPPFKFITLSVVGLAFGPALFFCFNEFVFGTPIGGYGQVAGSNGYFPADLPEKFISIWLDGMTLYGEPHSGLVEHFPWLFISLAGLVWVALKGDRPLKIVAISICVLYLFYLPYGDLLPNGLWRYLNIHYFKWTFPFLALFAFILLKDILVRARAKSGWLMPFLVLLITPLFLLSVYIKVETRPIEFMTGKQGISDSLRFNIDNHEVDFIDINGLQGGFIDIYMGDHKVFLDGRELKRIRDFRLLPIGAGVRMLFIRPIYGKELELIPDRRLRINAAMVDPDEGKYFISARLPNPFRETSKKDSIPPYSLGKNIDFSSNGFGSRYIASGFSGPEPWGIWSINGSSLIRMRILGEIKNTSYNLDLTMGALVNGLNNCQRVIIKSNDVIIGSEKICVSENSGLPKLHRFVIPANNISSDGKVELLILTPDSISPKSLNVNTDNRVLGVGLVNLRISN